MPPLEGKTVFISGGSRAAIGRAAVREDAEAVLVMGRRRGPGEELVAEQGEGSRVGAHGQAGPTTVLEASELP